MLTVAQERAARAERALTAARRLARLRRRCPHGHPLCVPCLPCTDQAARIIQAANDPAFGATNVAFGTWAFSRVNIWRRVPSGGARAWEVSGPTDVQVTDCWARREPGSNLSTVSHVNGSAEDLWTVSTDAPPGGDNVPAGSVGIGYVSPGYV